MESVGQILTINPKSWMKDLLAKQPNITLESLIIPGTHDSAAYKLTPLSGSPRNYFNRFAKIPLIGRTVRAIASISALTQKLSIKDQLEAGARSIDLRILHSKKPSPGQFSLAHSLTCITLKTCLNDIQAFIQENPHEMLVINIKPDWDNKDTLTDDKKIEFCGLLTNFFSEHLWKTDGQTPLLKQPLVSMCGKIILTLKDLPINPENGLHAKESLICDSWANKPRVNDCFAKGQLFYEQNKNDKAHMLEIDSSPTPAKPKTTALILYKILSSLYLYKFSCLLVKPFKRFFRNNPESTAQYFLDASETTLEKNGQEIREKLRELTLPRVERGGLIFPSDFFYGDSAQDFIQACVEKSKRLAEVLEKPDYELDHKEELDIENDLVLEHRHTLTLTNFDSPVIPTENPLPRPRSTTSASSSIRLGH